MPKKTFFNLPEEKRKKITDTLIKYFAEKPYSKVDIEDVAKECNVAKGSMYQYFENKKEMYFYAIEESLKKLINIAKKYNLEDMNFFEYVEKSSEDSWNFLVTHPYEYLLLEKTAFYDDSPYKEEVYEFLKAKTQNILYELIKRSQELGFIRDDISPEIIFAFVEGSSWALKRFFIQMVRQKGIKVLDLYPDYAREIRNQYMKLLKEGIVKRDS